MITASPIKNVGGYPNGIDEWVDGAHLYRLSEPAQVTNHHGTLSGEYIVVTTRPEDNFDNLDELEAMFVKFLGIPALPAATGVFFTDESGQVQDPDKQFAAHLIPDVEDAERGLSEFLDLINA